MSVEGLELTLGLPAAVAALERTLLDGLDVETCPARANVPVPAGELLLMPAATDRYAGVKIAGVAPANPAAGLPRITGSYLLLDGPTLRPLALLDGAALTALRTPAVTALALRALAAPDARHLVVFGAGPQALGHVDALRVVLPGLERVTVVARRPGPAARLAAHAASSGLDAAVGAPEAVAGADVVVCCTTARTPLFDGALVPDRAAVAAVGSHEPRAREVDARLVDRADLFVEAREVALREAGDLLMAGAGAERLANLAELVTGRAVVRHDRPRFFKSVGMAWQDLAVAAAQYAARGHGPRPPHAGHPLSAT
ncbi:ornithine cyclodeaminase family protein [Kitasatospora sp. NA04385]|uniref:ornithine cyclodeaminase family protein n=1 Tax=Kitasatospora sp. NA04385 TaxID=2742135 RepID=UPI0015904F67|nr:ornithine cyclodeaminase family protein [Kitasatospora sp. NA04385]QKW23013.1 ornithine cyclodeaminase family protein [Kitasatospora sp. NA04385]